MADSGHRKSVLILPNVLSKPGEWAQDRNLISASGEIRTDNLLIDSPCRARCVKQQKSHVGLEYAKFSLHEKWVIVHILIGLASPNGLKPLTAGEYTPGLDSRVSRAGYKL